MCLQESKLILKTHDSVSATKKAGWHIRALFTGTPLAPCNLKTIGSQPHKPNLKGIAPVDC